MEAIIIGGFLATFVVGIYLKIVFIRIHGESMAPTYRHGQFAIVVRKSKRTPRREKGDVVLLYSPQGTPVIKRIHTVEVYHGSLHYYVLGDNSEYSRDSRHYGHVAEDAIIGKVYPNLKSLK